MADQKTPQNKPAQTKSGTHPSMRASGKNAPSHKMGPGRSDPKAAAKRGRS